MTSARRPSRWASDDSLLQIGDGCTGRPVERCPLACGEQRRQVPGHRAQVSEPRTPRSRHRAEGPRPHTSSPRPAGSLPPRRRRARCRECHAGAAGAQATRPRPLRRAAPAPRTGALEATPRTCAGRGAAARRRGAGAGCVAAGMWATVIRRTGAAAGPPASAWPSWCAARLRRTWRGRRRGARPRGGGSGGRVLVDEVEGVPRR